MKIIVQYIDDCQTCPFVKRTADDYWACDHTRFKNEPLWRKIVTDSYDGGDILNIPDWCPLDDTESNGSKVESPTYEKTT